MTTRQKHRLGTLAFEPQSLKHFLFFLRLFDVEIPLHNNDLRFRSYLMPAGAERDWTVGGGVGVDGFGGGGRVGSYGL